MYGLHDYINKFKFVVLPFFHLIRAFLAIELCLHCWGQRK